MFEELARIYGLIAVIFLTGLACYIAAIIMIRPKPNKPSDASLARLALKNLGLDQKKSAWKTLVISTSRDVDVPLESLWETWCQIESWSDWSASHTAARWLGQPGWETGAKFEETLRLGFPLGFSKSVQTVAEVTPMRQVQWCKNQGGVRYCQVWSFMLLPNRKVRVTNAKVFHGTVIGLLKPAVVWQWQRQFEKSLTALVSRARQNI